MGQALRSRWPAPAAWRAALARWQPGCRLYPPPSHWRWQRRSRRHERGQEPMQEQMLEQEPMLTQKQKQMQ